MRQACAILWPSTNPGWEKGHFQNSPRKMVLPSEKLDRSIDAVCNFFVGFRQTWGRLDKSRVSRMKIPRMSWGLSQELRAQVGRPGGDPGSHEALGKIVRPLQVWVSHLAPGCRNILSVGCPSGVCTQCSLGSDCPSGVRTQRSLGLDCPS